MSDDNGSKNGRLSAVHGIQIGAVVAAISVIAYILQPVQTDIRRIESNLSEHTNQSSHAGTAADLAAIKTDLAAIRAEIKGADLLTRSQISAIQERIDYFRGSLASVIEIQNKQSERVARIEESLKIQGIAPQLGPVPNDQVHCFAKCHERRTEKYGP